MRKEHTEKIQDDKPEDLLSNLVREVNAYQQAINRLHADGAEFTKGDLAVAAGAVRGIVRALEGLSA